MVFFGEIIAIFATANLIKQTTMTYEVAGKPVKLSVKELEVLKLIAAGETSPSIAEAMCLSLPTIKCYRKRLRINFDAATSVQLVREAIEAGII